MTFAHAEAEKSINNAVEKAVRKKVYLPLENVNCSISGKEIFTIR
jgi:hypothetical protein